MWSTVVTIVQDTAMVLGFVTVIFSFPLTIIACAEYNYRKNRRLYGEHYQPPPRRQYQSPLQAHNINLRTLTTNELREISRQVQREMARREPVYYVEVRRDVGDVIGYDGEDIIGGEYEYVQVRRCERE
ncbi:hypothetical protein LTR64_002332 [Lithohypha guttulata]|uniref:Uncharacterized protein n=1 Tax=Lithohypha guttulata TaxID=1690604 RepID=A0AAN7PSF1_9EURO|nr:hypothetical protein LTR51_001442 [Lithohypha guttulata]KAK5080859.1 hypothetical protein LTR05_008175 [Lithohypha guttulata]